MDNARQIELIDQQIADAGDGYPDHFDEWRAKTDVVIRAVFGEDSPIHQNFLAVKYAPTAWVSGTDTSGYRPAGVKKAIAILRAGKLECELATNTVTDQAKRPHSNRVFIVHGRNDGRKYELESFLHKLLSDSPIILHQEPNGGRVLIEKFEHSANSVGYAAVLLTADDVGRLATLPTTDDQPRARQNVIFELGFFLGLLGRSRVAVLYDFGVELPNDIQGLVYIPLDAAGGWKSKIASEIGNAGIPIDWAAVGRV